MTDLVTEHLGAANIVYRYEQNLVGCIRHRGYDRGRPIWRHSDGTECRCGVKVATIHSVRSLPCKKAGHPPEMRCFTPSGWSYCGGCQEDSRQRYRERRAA